VSDTPTLTIREVARRTGIAAPTLRMWEARYGFPVPGRLSSGHRRYSADEVERLREVARDRDAGLSLAAAIDRVRRSAEEVEPSIFAGLRRRRPALVPYLLPKRTLIGLSHAIEDECCARAERPLLVASFQRESFYRDAEPRWRELARTAELAIVFADFPARRDVGGGLVELPMTSSAPLAREWSLVCAARAYGACLAAWERPGQTAVLDAERVFETIWTVDKALVREAVGIAAGLAAGLAPELAEQLRAAAEERSGDSEDQLELATALTSRMVAYVGSSREGALPTPHTARPA